MAIHTEKVSDTINFFGVYFACLKTKSVFIKLKKIRNSQKILLYFFNVC